MKFIYPVPKTSIVTQTYQDHVNVAKKHGWCYMPGTNCMTFYFGGIDWAVMTGTPVLASQAGTCDPRTDKTGYGTHVRITHTDGFMTIYGHLSKLNCKNGQKVKAGDIIGWSGSTGNSTGPHLHFELRKNSSPVDPAIYLVDSITDGDTEVPPIDKPNGVDISYHNGEILWDQMAAKAEFVIARSSYDGNFEDPQFKRNYSEATKYGVPFGAYHYVVPTASALQQFNLIKSIITKEMYKTFLKLPGSGIPLFALDCEGEYNLSKAKITACILELSNLIKEYYGYRPVIYTNMDFYHRGLNPSPVWKEHPLWVAHWYVDTPTLPDYWSDWAVWQYGISNDGASYGVTSLSKKVDVDYMKGSVVDPEPEPGEDNMPEFPALPEFEVSVSILNIRRGAGVTYPIVGTLRKSEIVTPFKAIKSGNDIWLQVGINQYVAYYYNNDYYMKEV